MKIRPLYFRKMNYNGNNVSQHMDVLGAVGGSVGQGLEVTAMDRLIEYVSRRKQVQDVGVGQGLVQAHFAQEHRKCS